MNDSIKIASKSDIRDALALAAYENDTVRLADPALGGWEWLVATHRGIFAVAQGRVKPVVHGWFFGICWHEGFLFAFENCGRRVREPVLGRILRFEVSGETLRAPRVIVTGLDNNCHQVAVIDGLLCVVDTANQAIRRYAIDGEPVDVRRLFPLVSTKDSTGAYVHVNSIAKVGGRIGVILHNGRAVPDKNSEIAWLDQDWRVQERHFLPGRYCHDIVEDEAGRLWHSLSEAGEIMRADGPRIAITDDGKLTRGIALATETMAVGVATFGPRHLRGTLDGSVVLLDRKDFRRIREVMMPAAPADIIAI